MKIEIKNVYKSFDDNDVLHDISFEINSGKALGLLGRNGAGKTTTIRILMDVFKCDSGEILIDDKPFKRSDYQIGYMPEERGMYPKLKIYDQLKYFGELRGLKKEEVNQNINDLLEELEMSEFKNRRLDTLSKGNQQKIQLAQTLLCNPDIIILDEPFSGLDPVNSQILKNMIRKRINENKLVIFSSHQMSYVEEFCDDIVIINKGHITLKGELNSIKKEMGKGNIILRLNGYSLEELKDLIVSKYNDYLEYIETKKDYIIFKSLKDKNNIINKLSDDNLDIALFADYMPSLTDIFVRKAGE